jgi:osmotically-inducible protein OsmY
VRSPDRLTGLRIISWAALGTATGLVAGFALGELVGGVTPHRIRRAARRVRDRPDRPAGRSAADGARAVRAALHADPRLTECAIEAIVVARGVVDLHGWVPSRALRAHAGRVARGVPEIESVINSILVRGEDDRSPSDYRATDQSA